MSFNDFKYEIVILGKAQTLYQRWILEFCNTSQPMSPRPYLDLRRVLRSDISGYVITDTHQGIMRFQHNVQDPKRHEQVTSCMQLQTTEGLDKNFFSMFRKVNAHSPVEYMYYEEGLH